MTSILCEWSKLTSFQSGRSALICFLCRGRKPLGFCVSIENNWLIVSGHRNRLDTRLGIKIDLISVMGSKFALLLCAGSKFSLF